MSSHQRTLVRGEDQLGVGLRHGARGRSLGGQEVRGQQRRGAVGAHVGDVAGQAGAALARHVDHGAVLREWWVLGAPGGGKLYTD